jgi:hypothetical protein
MFPYRDSRFTLLLLAAFFAIALGYALFEVRGMLFGPSISVAPEPAEVHEAYLVVSGTTSRISALTMNGEAVPVTEDGAFSQGYLLAPGYNRIILDAKDSYGRTRSHVLELMYLPNATSSLSYPGDPLAPTASSSATSTAL